MASMRLFATVPPDPPDDDRRTPPDDDSEFADRADLDVDTDDTDADAADDLPGNDYTDFRSARP